MDEKSLNQIRHKTGQGSHIAEEHPGRLYGFSFFFSFSFDLSDMELGERKHFPNIRWENVIELSEMHCKSCGKNVFSPQ